MRRRDGSIQSSNLPAFNKMAKNRIDRDFGVYRCMITRTYFVDDPNNTTYENQQVTYEAVIIGGPKEGQILQNVKSMSEYGGQYNYSEKIYRPISTKNLEDLPISEHVGDIVFICFIQGNTRAPAIMGAGVQPQDLDFTGSTIADGYRSQKQYNGIYELIDKNGNYLLRRKGGALDTNSGIFVPNQTGNITSFQLNGNQIIHTASGATIVIDGKADSVKIKTAGGGEVNIVAGKIAIGAGSTELFDQLSKTLDKLSQFFTNKDATHDHIGNLGYPSSPPETAADFATLGSDLAAIKALIDGIKGTL